MKLSHLSSLSFAILSILFYSCESTSPSSTPSAQLVEMSIDEGTNMAVALSPDGETVAFDVLGRIWLMPADGGKAIAITDSLGNARQPSWSPDGSQLTFQGYWQGNWHIYVVNSNGSSLKQMTSGSYDYREPNWSPDGTTLAFSSDRSGNYDIWTLDIVSEKLLPLTTSPANEYGPSWSADGKQLAYVSANKGPGEIVIQSLENQSKKIAYKGWGKLTGISWSPTGSKILFNQHAGIQAELKQIDLASGQTNTLTNSDEDVFPFRHSWTSDSSFIYTATGKIQSRTLGEPIEEIPFTIDLWLDRSPYERKSRDFNSIEEQKVKGIGWPTLSPDGKSVAFVALQDLWLKQVGGTAEQLTNDPFVQIMPTWSPDGKTLAYSSDKDGSFAIWTIDLETRNEEKLLSTGASISGMAWSPNGNSIAFTESYGPKAGQLNLLDVNTGEKSILGERLGSSIGTPTWSPDGSIIGLTALDPYSSLYREGVNRVMLLSLDGKVQRPQKAIDHWSFGVRGNNGPVWSPDGTSMAIIAKGSLWLLPVDENGDAIEEPIKLTDELADLPSWSADSKQLLYMATDRLKLIKVADKTTTVIETGLSWKRRHPEGTTIIHAGGLINGVSDSIRMNMDIVLEGHRIVEIARHDETRTADKMIDASDAFLMPGLIDIHAHEGSTNGEKLGRAWLSWGVTSMRNPAGDPYDALNRRESIQSGKIQGPRIYFTGSPIDGNRIFYGGTGTMDSERQIEMELRKAKLLDYDLIKTYVRLPDNLQQKVIDGAHNIGLPVTSHELYPAVSFNIDGVEHVKGTSRRGFSAKLSETQRAYDDVTDMIAQSGMHFTPTTAIYLGYQYVIARDPSVTEDQRLKELTELWYLASISVSTEEIKANQAAYDQLYNNVIKMVADVQRKGGLVVAGTDSPILPQGFGLHIELENYQDAGLTPFEVLKTATINNAIALNAEGDLGSIEVGKLADMVIVEANPLKDIRNARKTRAVIKNGKLITLQELMKRPH